MRLEGTPLFDASWVPIVDFGGRKYASGVAPIYRTRTRYYEESKRGEERILRGEFI